MRAYNRAGCGAWSQPLETISGAGPPDKPREPKAVVSATQSAAAKNGGGGGTVVVTISWDAPINNGAIITGYLLQVSRRFFYFYLMGWLCQKESNSKN